MFLTEKELFEKITLIKFFIIQYRSCICCNDTNHGTRNTKRGTRHSPQIFSITFGKCSYSSLCTLSAIISGVSVGNTGHVA